VAEWNGAIVVERGVAVPPWRQLYGILRGRIESGDLPPRSRLPSILSLSQEYDLATVTVRKALAQLREDGLIETVTGWGSFVVINPMEALRVLPPGPGDE
jgi:GntR family transcriptional regulator